MRRMKKENGSDDDAHCPATTMEMEISFRVTVLWVIAVIYVSSEDDGGSTECAIDM